MEPNEKKIAVMVFEEKEVKKPEKKIITIEYSGGRFSDDATYVLGLTPEQYRLMEWLSTNELLSDDLEWYDGKPEVEIKEI